MVSGKYSALAGAVAREQAMANISNNLANVNTTGFKKDRISFESILRGSRQTGQAKGINYSRIRTIGTDFSQGALKVTDNPLDLAIQGQGFFKIRQGKRTLYTRDGSFHLDSNGMLKTADGFSVLNESGQPVQLTETSGRKITIAEDGGIIVDGQVQDRLQVFTVDDPAGLKKIGGNRFALEQGTDRTAESSRIVQGSLETSNVNMMEEMVMMINSQRRFEACHKALKSYSTIAEKNGELGTVG